MDPGTSDHGEMQGAQDEHHMYYMQNRMAQAAYGYNMDPQHWGTMGHIQHQMYHHTYGYHYPVQHMEGVPLPPGIPGLGGSTDPLEAVLGPFPCTRLGSLPYDTTLEEILILFQGLVVIDVVIVGQGTAFVVFANPMDFQMALQRHRQTIGRRFIDISRASRTDYYEAIAAQHERERGPHIHSGVSFLGDEALSGDEQPQPHQPPAEASSVSSSLWGDTAPVPQSMQAVPVEGLHHAPTAMVAGGRGGGAGRGGIGPLQKRTGGGIQVGDHTGFLRMRGLPFSASKDDIIKFFVGYNPVPESIVLTYRNDGRATGEAYVGFASSEDSKRAMDLHRRTMGSRYIELFISNREEQGRALARFGNR